MKRIGTTQDPTHVAHPSTNPTIEEAGKRALLLDLANVLVGAPQDTQPMTVSGSKSALDVLREQTRALEAELSRTLSEWRPDPSHGGVLQYRAYQATNPDARRSPPEFTTFTRRDALSKGVVVSVSRSNESPEWVVCYRHPELGTFRHPDLDVAKSMADLMARASGYRMVEDVARVEAASQPCSAHVQIEPPDPFRSLGAARGELTMHNGHMLVPQRVRG